MNNGWMAKKLGDLCDVLDSARKPITKKDRTAGPYPYYGATGVLDYVDGYLFDEPLVLIGEDGAKWGSGDSTAFAITGKSWVNNHAHVVRPNRAAVMDAWLIHYLNHSDLSEFITGLTVPKLNQSRMREIPVPVPPLGEQERIVGILDEAFAAIATATANTQTNLTNARAVFENHLNQVFMDRGADWVSTGLGEVGTTQTGSTPKSSEAAYYGHFIPFVKPADFRPDGSLVYDNDGLSELGLSRARKVPAGAALMVCIGATIGKCGYCDRDITTNQQINALIPAANVSYRFVFYQMLTNEFQKQVRLNSGQATLPIINKGKWSELSISMPPHLSEQTRIANKIDGICGITQQLESMYERKLSLLAELKQSLLQQAFAGEL